MIVEPRYRVVESSNHSCCNSASVVDMQVVDGEEGRRPSIGDFNVVCECFDSNDAEIVCAALNKAATNATGWTKV